MLSRYYKLKEIIDLLRVFTGEIGKNNLQDTTIKSIIKNNTLAIAAQLNNELEPDYGEMFIINSIHGFVIEMGAEVEKELDLHLLNVSVKQPTYTDISNLRIDKIIKLVSDKGELHKAGDKEFESILKHEEFNKYIFYNYYGSKLYFKRGNSSEAINSLVLYYYRLPKVDITDSDYIDLKDKHIPLLIEKCKNEIKELTGNKAIKAE